MTTPPRRPRPRPLRLAVPAAYGDAERHRDDLERLAALALALLAAGASRRELERRLRGYERADAYEVAP